MQQQVSSYLLQGFTCQKDPPPVRILARHTRNQCLQERETALPLSLHSEPQPCAQAQTSACTCHRSPSVACKGTVHLSGSRSLLLSDTRLGNKAT